MYGYLADAVVIAHFLWIVFLFAGGIWGRRYKIVKAVHLGGLAFALMIQVFNWYCPLTILEVYLRQKQNPFQTYSGSFIVHYAEELIYINLSRTLIFALTIVLIAANAWFYLARKTRQPR
ncbi:MAG: DUF2784 domain-containing protein [Nitrospiraceae bacterium]|nr:DUF2784 domain-containing protein [Nitrospiraceae bacterium]